MVRIEDVTNSVHDQEGRQGQGNGSSSGGNVRRRNVDLDDLNIDDSKLPSKKPAAVVQPTTTTTTVSRQSASAKEESSEGEDESENEEATALVAAGGGEVEEQSAPEQTFDEQVDAARAAMQPTPMEKFMAICKSLILRAMVIYFVMYFLRSGTSSKPATNSTSTGSGAGTPAPASLASTNIYNNGTIFDMYVYISEDKESLLDFNNANLIWLQERIIYGDWTTGPNSDGTLVHDVDIVLSKKIQNNGSLYIHSYIVPEGFSPDSSKIKYDKDRTIYSNKMLNKFKRKKYSQTLNLLTGESSQSLEDQEKAKTMKSEIISHWHPNLTLAFVTDFTAWTMGAVPSPLNEYIKFLPKELKYQPVLFYNDYWNLMKEYQPINSTVKKIHLTLTYQPLSLFKWQIYAAQSMRNQWQTNLFTGGGEVDDEEDQDTLKETILGTNPYLLFLTFAISLLHSVFEFLAFKNDIQFWNNRKSLEGLSVRSVFFNVFQSLIVLLYILDNETNFVIKVSVFIGLLIEVWKINKVTDVTIDRENLIFGIIPRIKISDKGSYVESSTRKYDILAFRYLSWVLFPLIVGYAIYSIVYHEHKSWYSWVLSMAYGFLLTFGFIMMTPQLFINYKLKSVAHLPWKMLSYKFLNTFIDDIFAFVIKMPTMYRIGCLRDDVIFFVYLYQRYIYRIDPTRVNEFGFSAEMLENKDKQLAPVSTESSAAITETNTINNPSTSKSSTEPKPVSKKTKSKKEKKVQ